MSVIPKPTSIDSSSITAVAADGVALAESAFFKSPVVKLTRWLAYALTACIVLGLPTAWICGFRIVTTPSVPRGIWRIYPGTVVKNGFVAICLPEDVALYGVQQGYLLHGICPGNTESLMKRVVAVAGDQVNISALGVRVNGVLFANSARLAYDDERRRTRSFVAVGDSVVASNTYWLLGINKRSWDSRYFGPVPSIGILGVGVPFIVESVPDLFQK